MPEHETVPAQPTEERARNIAQGLGSLTLQNLATSILGFLFLAALLRLLPQVQYGVYSAVNVSISIGSTFAMFGLNQAMARYVAFLRQRDEAQAWAAAKKILSLALIFTIIVTAAYAAAAPYLSEYFTKSVSWTDIFVLAGAYLFLGSLSGICLGVVQGLKRYVLLAKMMFASKVVMIVFGIGALFLYRNVTIPILAWIIYSAVIVTWTLALVGKTVIRASGDFAYSTVLKYSYPIGVAALIAAVASSADIIVVGGYLNPVSLGVYNAAVTISTILSAVLVGPLTTAFLPEVSSSS
ncbi:MAG: oligosaccharide flippase family protein, partial [Nitrososphaerota archaeon]|nr:oligosaccharide flippase family protein [Nitrososphaerota archaeon]